MDSSYKLPYRLIIVLFLSCGWIAPHFAQEKVPQTLNYQAVARDSLDNPIANKDIVIEISILQGDSKTLVWQETHSVTTDKYGVFALLIGNGVTTAKGSKYSFSDINWETDDHYLRTRVDFGVENFGNGLINMGTVKFQSVPYALVAEKALNAVIKLEELTDVEFGTLAEGNGIVYDGTNWVDKTVITADGKADLSGDWTISSNSIILSKGGVVTAKFTMGSTQITGITKDGTFPEDVANHNNLATVQAVKEYVDANAGGESLWMTANDPAVVTNASDFKNRNLLFDGLKYESGTDPSTDPNSPIPSFDDGGGKLFYVPTYGIFRVGGSSNSSWNKESMGKNSIAFGHNNIASGNYSFAQGSNCSANGLFSVVFGDNCVVENDYAISFGQENVVKGNYSLAAGKFNEITGQGATCFGTSNIINANTCLAVGVENIVGEFGDANNSLAIGTKNLIEAPTSFIYGSDNKSYAEGSLAGGAGSSTKGKYSVAMGAGIISNSFGEVAVGTYNENIAANNKAEFDKSDNVFVVGYGESSGARANALWVDKGGTTHVKDFDNLSDSIMKTMITPLPNALDNVLQLRPVNFYWKEDFPIQEGENPQKQIGLIAQEVEKIYPELVTNIPGRKLTMDYVSLTAVLIKAIQEQQQQIDSLKQANNNQDGEIVKLKAEYQNLQSRISAIEELLNSSSSKE